MRTGGIDASSLRNAPRVVDSIWRGPRAANRQQRQLLSPASTSSIGGGQWRRGLREVGFGIVDEGMVVAPYIGQEREPWCAHQVKERRGVRRSDWSSPVRPRAEEGNDEQDPPVSDRERDLGGV